MAAITLPITFRAFRSPALQTPMVSLSRTVTSLQPDELLIAVSYASVNPSDGKMQQHNIFKAPLPLMLGFDFSGTVVAVGGPPSSTAADCAVSVGSAVFGFCNLGAFAEHVVANRAHVIPKGAIPEADASTYGGAFPSAYEALEMEGHLSERAGQWVFIPGGAGGVGHFAVQLAKAAGLQVVSSASKHEGLALLERLGIPLVLNYAQVDVVAEVLAITGGEGVDLVFDATYVQSSMEQSAATVKPGGLWLRLGDFAAEDAEARRIAEGRGAKAGFGSFGRYIFNPQYRPRMHLVMAGMIKAVKQYEEGTVRPHINAVVPFEPEAVQGAVDAVLNNRMNVGKVTVKLAQ